jgi:group I intron endonuclease
MNKNTGIYEIKNRKTGKKYIGSTNNFIRRKKYHWGLLRVNKHVNPYLQHAWNKYGEDNFDFSTIIYCDEKNLIFYEQIFLDAGWGHYNIAKKAGKPPSWLGRKHLNETKEKLSKIHIGRKSSEESKKKMSESKKGKCGGKLNGFYGKTHNEESKKKMSRPQYGPANGMYGKTHSHKSKAHLREKMIGANNPFFGKTHSDESKQKIRQSKGVSLPNKEEFELVYRNNKNKEAAKYFNIDVTTIDKWRKMFNLSPKRIKQNVEEMNQNG